MEAPYTFPKGKRNAMGKGDAAASHAKEKKIRNEEESYAKIVKREKGEQE